MDNSHCIKYHQTSAFSKLFLDYVDAAPQLREFYEHLPSLNSIEDAIKIKQKENTNRELLVQQLNEQYKGIELNANVKSNILSLLDKNTYTITTGHQLAIYTGEWYFIFKILTAIKMAEEAKTKFPNYNFVPVFWMASEDHDFEEINHIHLNNQKFEWKLNAKGPTGRLSVESIGELTKSLKSYFANRVFAEELISIFEKAYTNENTLAEATRILVNELFKEYGLVVLDADDKELKKSWSENIRKELLEEISFAACKEQTSKLENLNYPSQIYPREINLFYLMDGFRERIIKERELYKTVDGYFSFDKNSIEKEIENNPERFSPNVVLRPVYQESILPNLCYIGGPGEIAYWLQLKTVFEKHKVAYPIVAWRNSFMIAEKKDLEKWKSFDFEIKDLFRSILELENEYVSKHQTKKIKLTEEETLLKKYIDAIKKKAMSVDENLQFSLQGTEKRILRMMERIENKIWKAEKKKYKDTIEKIQGIKEKYFPKGKLQERHNNCSLWYTDFGKAGIAEILRETNPFSDDFKCLIF